MVSSLLDTSVSSKAATARVAAAFVRAAKQYKSSIINNNSSSNQSRIFIFMGLSCI